MPCVTSHDFNYLHPSMRAGRRARSFDDLGNVAQRSVKTESVISAFEIFVDRLGHADNLHPAFGQPGGNAQSIFATADHQGVELQFFNVLDYVSRSIFDSTVFGSMMERISSRRAQISSPVTIPSTNCSAFERKNVGQRIQQTSPAIEQTDDVQVKFRASIDHTLNGRIQSRRIASVGTNTNTLRFRHD